MPIQSFQQNEDVGMGKGKGGRFNSKKRGAAPGKGDKNKDSKEKEKDKKRAKQWFTKKVFPSSYDPNQWEQRASSNNSKEQPLLIRDSSSDQAADTVAHANHKRKNGAKRRRRGSSITRRLKPTRVALVFAGSTLVAAIILFLVMAAWGSWPNNSPPSSQTAINATTDSPLERTRSYLEVDSLPASTQLLLLAEPSTTPQHQAFQWLQRDPYDTIIGKDQSPNATSSLTPLETLSCRQRFALATLYYATNGPDGWDQPSASQALQWMEWISTNRNVTGSACLCSSSSSPPTTLSAIVISSCKTSCWEIAT